MGWDQIVTLFNEGYTIESHSVHHPNLTQIPEDEAWDEITSSRLEIEKRLGNEVQFFAYPGGMGAYDPWLQGLVQDAGYQAAVSAWPAGMAKSVTSNLWALPRIEIGQENGVHLDLDQPEAFFMRQVDPDFPLPTITVDAPLYLNQDGAPQRCFEPGETITANVTATNHGDPASVQIVFSLDDAGQQDDIAHSRLTDLSLTKGESALLSYNLILDDDLAPGLYSDAVELLDEHAVLSLWRSGWQPALLLSESCSIQQLPTIRR